MALHAKIATLSNIDAIATKSQVNAWLHGSVAVEILANVEVNKDADIDLVCKTLKDRNILIKELVEHGYVLNKDFSWKATHFGKGHTAKLTSPEQIDVDVAYIKGEIHVAYKTNQLLSQKNIHLFSVDDLLKIYRTFGERNPKKNKVKIQLLESYIVRNKKDHTRSPGDNAEYTSYTPQ